MAFQGKDLAHKIYVEMWNNRQFDLIDTLLDPHFCLKGTKTAIQNRDQYKNVAQEWLKIYPEIQYRLEDVVAAENKIAVRWQGADLSKNFVYNGLTLLIIKNERVKNAWEYSDA
ncbi:MAG: ester cyclase [Proteobacteria bacterium]|nr:ester cyclase [Pseudomonadota bacterium]